MDQAAIIKPRMPFFWQIDRGEGKIVKVRSEHHPNKNCKSCFGRGHNGTYLSGPNAGLLVPCGCIGMVEEIKHAVG